MIVALPFQNTLNSFSRTQAVNDRIVSFVVCTSDSDITCANKTNICH